MKKIYNRKIYVLLFTLFLMSCGDKNTTFVKSPSQQPDDFYAKVIYGDDDRLDIYQVQNQNLLSLADSTVALIQTSDLKSNGAVTKITTTKYATSYRLPLCPTERFREQDTAAFCSGFLVAPNIMVTAGHCIKTDNSPSSDCATTKFVFGFDIKTANSSPTSVPTSEVYSCKRIIKQVLTSTGADFSVIQLDRNVSGHRPLRIRRSGVPTTRDELTVIGHPSGLPTKIAGNAKIRKILPNYIQASLDTYGGNSGSAVFNSSTYEVEGILVRGESDFEAVNGCMSSKKCGQNECRGEDVTRISEILSYVPEQPDTNPLPDPNTELPTPPSVAVYNSTPHLNIPDNNANGAEAVIVADQAPNGRSVSVQVNITHPWRGDLVLKLVAPDGRVVTLVNRKGRSADDIVGTYGVDLVPDENLNALALVNQTGVWKLFIYDLAARDVGLLNSWSLRFGK